MELAFAHPSGVVSRYWGAGGRTPPQHAFGRRTLTPEELSAIAGGDDGGGGGDAGDCGAGGDCGADSGACGDGGCAPADPNAVSLPGVTVIGIAPNPAVPSLGDAASAIAIASLLGGGAGAVAFGTGAAGMMSLGDAIALGTILGGVVAIATMGITITGFALLGLLANYAATNPNDTGTVNPMGDPLGGYGPGPGSDGP